MPSWTSDLRIYPLGGTPAMGVPLYSARGLTETIEQVAGAGERTIDGVWRNLTPSVYKVLRISFTCQDMQLPPFLWVGDQRTIECIAPMSHLTAGGVALRTARTALNADSPLGSDPTFIEGDYTFTRMLLDVVRVEPGPLTFAEWEARAGWQIVFEEIAPPA